jgi:CRP-like cAMP-binding protein
MRVFAELMTRLAIRTQPVRVARTAAERDAIAALRYQIYVREQRDPHPDADHVRQRLWSAVDDHPDTLNFYVGTVDDLRGVVRVRAWSAGAVPDDLWTAYSMERLPGVQDVPGCECSALMCRRDLRGTAAIPALTTQAALHLIAERGVVPVFTACSPGHAKHYMGMGFRPYGGATIRDSYGMLLPLVGLVPDLDHLRAVGSFWYPPFVALQRQGRLPTLPDERLRTTLERSSSVVVDSGAVAEALQRMLDRCGGSLLHGLGADIRTALAEHGLVVSVAAGDTVVHRGAVDREVFVVLEGRLEQHEPGRRAEDLGPGDLVGEVDFFRSGGGRRASVVAVAPARLLIVRHSLLARLSERAPEQAVELCTLYARAMAHRLGGAAGGVGAPLRLFPSDSVRSVV